MGEAQGFVGLGGNLARAIPDQGRIERSASGPAVPPYELPATSLPGYFPEPNPLVPLAHRERLSKSPAAKGAPRHYAIGTETAWQVFCYTDSPARCPSTKKMQSPGRGWTESMLEDEEIRAWFCREVLPLENQLTRFIRRNWRNEDDVTDLRQDVYERAIAGARKGLPHSTRPYLFAIARNHLINRAKRARIVLFDVVADLEASDSEAGAFQSERQFVARETLRRMEEGLAKLTPRVRQIVRLRKIQGFNTQETADYLGIGSDAVRKQTSIGMRALADHLFTGDDDDGAAAPARWTQRSRGRRG